MGKGQKKVLAELQAAIKAMQNPAANPAQNYLTQSAIEGAEFMKKGDFSQLPKGQFFDFKTPVEDMKQYDRLMNVGNTGTFALGDNEGSGKALALAGDYRKNMFARSAADNYQNNIRGASARIQGGLEQAAGAKGQTDQSVVGALQGLYRSMPQGGGFMSMLPSLIGAGTSLATKFL